MMKLISIFAVIFMLFVVLPVYAQEEILVLDVEDLSQEQIEILEFRAEYFLNKLYGDKKYERVAWKDYEVDSDEITFPIMMGYGHYYLEYAKSNEGTIVYALRPVKKVEKRSLIGKILKKRERRKLIGKK